MVELRIMYTYGLNARYSGEYKIENTLMWQKKFPSLPRKHKRINPGSIHKGFCKLAPQKFHRKFNTMLDTNIRDITNFIRTCLSSMRKSHLESTHEASFEK